MIFLAAATARPLALYTTLQGMPIQSLDRLLDLAKSRRFLPFVVHLPDNHGNMPGFKISEDYVLCLESLAPVDSVEFMTMSADAQVDYALLDLLSRRPSWEVVRHRLPKSAFVGWRRAGSLSVDRVEGQALRPPVYHRGALTCQWTPFYDNNVVLPNGDVTPCCMDYGLKHVIGNLLEQDYYQMFAESDELRQVVAGNMGSGCETICRSCEKAVSHQPTLKGRWQASR